MSSLASIKQHPALQAYPLALNALHSVDSLADALALLNNAHRSGQELVPDHIYDSLFVPALVAEDPTHPFLNSVEPEPLDEASGPLVRHTSQLLSTDKAYTQSEVDAYLKRVEKDARSLGIAPETLTYRLTPKLDGISAVDEGEVLATRGDGLQGRDITRVINHGVVMEGGRGLGRGELVCDRAFFDAHLGPDTEHAFENTRNFIIGFQHADTLKPHHKLALDAKALRFIPFSTLPDFNVTADELRRDWLSFFNSFKAASPYDTDGVIVQVNNRQLHQAMGATNKFERAVVAVKQNTDEAESTLQGVRLTTGRTGRIVPTLLIDPVTLSGVTVSKATAHTAKNLFTLGLGVGAKAMFTRGGEVIPKFLYVTEKSANPIEVTHCPSCGEEAVVELINGGKEEGQHLICPNTMGCQAQAEARLRHWFITMGNVDEFGPVTIKTLVDAGITSLERIYAMSASDFARLGFGPVQSENFVIQLERSRTEAVADWRFLAAIGIRHLGRGDAKKLLAQHPLDTLHTLSASDVEGIAGFGPTTSPVISATLSKRWPHIEHMLALGFNLERTPLASEAPATQASGVLSGEKVVFTGTMKHGKRKDMEAHAASLGADVQSDVNGQTTLLVIGEKAGSKLTKAEKINAKAGRAVVTIQSESDYLARIE